MSRWAAIVGGVIGALLLVSSGVHASGQGQFTVAKSTLSVHESRVTHDNSLGSYARYDGQLDAVMQACSTSRRAQSEPSVSIDPHNPQVILVTATDRCNHTTTAVGNGGEEGIYRSTDGGSTWAASLVPGYLGDTSPAAATAIGSFCKSAQHGESDSTVAFDADGTAYLGFQCGNGTGPLDELVATYADDGSRYVRTVHVAPGPPGTADDKPNLAVDRSDTPSRGNIYVAWSRYSAPLGTNAIPQVTVATSTDHGKSFVLSAPLTGALGNFANLAVGPDGVVYLAYSANGGGAEALQIMVSKSTDHGRTFRPPTLAAALLDGYPVLTNENQSRGCGDGPTSCTPNYTGPYGVPYGAIAADKTGVHLVWNQYTALGQDKIYVANSPDGVVWPPIGATLDKVTVGHQFEPAITSSGGRITVAFYDSRYDAAYAPLRPVGNTSDGKNSGPAVDAFVAQSADGGKHWIEQRVSTRSWNPNWESYQYARGAWQGDYIYADSVPGQAFVVWTDSRDIVPGVDSRDPGAGDGFDVYAPCRWAPGGISQTTYSSPNYQDACLSQGGLDQNIYGASLMIAGASPAVVMLPQPQRSGLPDTAR